MSTYAKVLPVPDDTSRAYWEGARRHRLTILRCSACGLWIHYPRPDCPRCAATALEPTAVSGRGTVYTFTRSHYVGGPGFEHETPYVIMIVELEEQPGVRIVSNLRDCPVDAVHVGMPVEVVFEDVDADVSLPQFRPQRAAS